MTGHISIKRISPTRRLAALAQIIQGLGQAIDGMSRLGPDGAVKTKELSDQLVMLTKRASWIEKMGDEDWVPTKERGKP